MVPIHLAMAVLLLEAADMTRRHIILPGKGLALCLFLH